MLSTKETPKKLAAVLEKKNLSCSGIAVDFVNVYSKSKKATNFSTYPRRTYFNFSGRKVLRNGLVEKLLSEDLGIHLSELFLKNLFKVCIKISERH